MTLTSSETDTNLRRLNYPLILGSGSPRRQELLASLHLDFTVIVPDVDEEAFHLKHLDPATLVQFLSRAKAQEVFKYNTKAYVIGADTVVALDGKIFGKPKDADDAYRMLTALQGRWHEVHSGITVFNPDKDPKALPFVCESRCTKVFMRSMSPEQVRTYVETGEPMDKAGAYAIQGYGAAIIERVDGCYFNVVGMSLNLLDNLFSQLNAPLIL
jgi:septum formation protein